MPAKSIPISKTKIIVPSRRPDLLSRPRLVESLKSLLDNKLILLSAPAGYGKTSLLIDLIHHIEMSVCWLSLDLLDRDPQRFIAYLIASLAEKFPGIGETSLVQLKQLKSIEHDAEPLLVMLTNEIYDHVDGDFLLIIDDYHLVDDMPVISSLVNRFLELADENCHIILSSRTLPSLEDVTLMVAREQVAGISHEELAFIPREVQALYSQNYHEHLSDEAASEFVEKTGGWITGMILSSRTGIARVPGVDTFAYLGRQVLDQQLEHVREFLMRTSLPEEFNAEICETILGPFHSGPQSCFELMGLILEKNLFVLPLGSDGRWLRYHPLFREFLQARLREERPQEVPLIIERLVIAYEQAGEWERAYFTCSQLNDPVALAGVIERSGNAMLQSALVTLEGWINSLPPAIVRERPGLISLRGSILAMKGYLQESLQILDSVVTAYRKREDKAGLLFALIRRANTLRLSGNYAGSIRDADEAMQLAEYDTAFQLHYAECLRIKGLNFFRMGESRKALESLEHSLSLYTALNETGRIPAILMDTGMAHGAVGDMELAKTSYQKALKIRREEKNLYSQAEILNNLAVLHHQLGEYEIACDTFEDGLVCARKSRNRRAESLILTGLGDLYVEVDEFDAAIQAYRQAAEVARELPGFFISNYLIIANGNLALMKGDIEQAGKIIGAHGKKIKAGQSAYERGLWMLFEGRFHLQLNEPRKAITLLKECRELFTQDGRDIETHWSLIWLTAAYELMGQRQNARNEISEILGMASSPAHSILMTLGRAGPMLDDLLTDPQSGSRLASLFERSQRMIINLPAIRRMLRHHAQSIEIPLAGLRIQAFGHPEVSLNGQVISMSEWRTQSVRDLFFFFVNNQEKVTKEQVGAALWPETEDPLMLKARFKNDIYRLRRAAGKNVIVFEEEYYCFNRDLDYEYDVEAFTLHLKHARASKDKEKRIQLLQKAVDLVRGPYLADVDAEWAVSERERFGQAYVSALEELAQGYLAANLLTQCLSVCRLALQKEPYHENIYQLEMRAYAALHDRASIVRTYQACKSALQNGLGLSPTKETELLYHELSR